MILNLFDKIVFVLGIMCLKVHLISFVYILIYNVELYSKKVCFSDGFNGYHVEISTFDKTDGTYKVTLK